MNIGIDLTWVKPQISGGIESFARNLLDGLVLLKTPHQYMLFLSKDNYSSFIRFKDGGMHFIVVGSDQVWRKWGATWDIKYYFMNFADGWNIKKISYAASFGVNSWDFNRQETLDIRQWLKQYASVSVRENDAVKLCKKNLNIDAEWNIDPTMLLNMVDYKKLVKNTKTELYPVVTYILDPSKEKLEVRDKICRQKGVKPMAINIQEGISNNGTIEMQPSLESWLNCIMNAGIVITDSFHGTAFAINFNKPFIVLSNQLRGQSRLMSVLEMFGLENRLIERSEDAERIAGAPIDWDRVNIILDAQRTKSDLYFKKNQL